MVLRWHRLAIIAGMMLAAAAIAGATEPSLSIVYPLEGQRLPAIDSTFVFGSSEPGAQVTVNGIAARSHKDGGWLAFVPVMPGEFIFVAMADKDGRSDTLTRTVFLPDLPSYDYDSLYIFPGSMAPNAETWLRPGAAIDLRLRSLPYCNAFCVVLPMHDTVSLKEEAPRSYFGGANVFDETDAEWVGVPDSLAIRGVYSRTYTIPETTADSLTFVYHVYRPSLDQLVWLDRYLPSTQTSMTMLHRLASLVDIAGDTCSVSARLLHPNALPVAELKDSLTIIRSGPGKGYLSIHQPPGIRGRIIGKEGRWYRLELSPYQSGWIIDTSAVLLSPDEPVPHSYIRRITTIDYDDRVSVVAATTARHPFRVIENSEEKSITVLLYGVDADTDWTRYDNSDDIIDHIVWIQPEPGVFGLVIHLGDERIWGYDAYYAGKEFRFEIKKFPRKIIDISQLRIVIDAGHGPDLGAVGPTGLTEQEANLAIARRLKKTLERRGAEVIMTRSDSAGLELYDRPRVAVAERADLFISIHNNALPDGTNPFVNNGTSTFYYHPHSAPLARAVHRSLTGTLPLNDFGWYYGNLAVIRPTQYPAILIECAFMMLPEQEAMLKSGKFTKQIADAIVAGIEDFIRGHKKTEWDIQQDVSYGR